MVTHGKAYKNCKSMVNVPDTEGLKKHMKQALMTL